MTNPAQPGAHQGGRYPGPSTGTGQFAPVGYGPLPPPAGPRRAGGWPAPLAAASAALLVIAGGLAVTGSFAAMETETQRVSDTQTFILTYTSWTLRASGTLHLPIDFHAPHFGYPLAGSALLVLLGAALLLFGTGRLARIAAPAAAAGAGLLAGTVWAVGMSVTAELDDVEHREGYSLDWATGLGFWLLLGAGVVAIVGGVLAMIAPRRENRPDEPATPRYGFPALGQPYPPAGAPQGGPPPAGPPPAAAPPVAAPHTGQQPAGPGPLVPSPTLRAQPPEQAPAEP